MSIHKQIKTEHDARIKTPHDKEAFISNNYSFAIFSALFLGVVFVGLFAFYSQQFISKEYGSTVLDKTLMQKEVEAPEWKPDHCDKLKFRNETAKKKLGC